jgi:fructokinase
VDRQILEGRNSFAGEWGHAPLPWPTRDEYPGPACWCGRRNCMELWVSGPAFARDSGQPAETAVEAARQGDAYATAFLDQYVDRLARGLAVVCNVLDPDVIVLGGGMSNVDRLYTEVPRLWGRTVFSDHVATRLERNRHGDSSGVRGAAWLWDTSRDATGEGK